MTDDTPVSPSLIHSLSANFSALAISNTAPNFHSSITLQSVLSALNTKPNSLTHHYSPADGPIRHIPTQPSHKLQFQLKLPSHQSNTSTTITTSTTRLSPSNNTTTNNGQ